MSVKAILIDDEQHNNDNLFRLLQEHCPAIQVVATATAVDEGISLIQEKKPDLLFLDIQMPEKNGFDLLKALNTFSFEIIFVSAYDHYGIQAIKFSAIDYLLKPVNTDELKAAVKKVVHKAQEKKQNLQLENLLQFLQQSQQRQEHRIALPTSKETRFINTGRIIRCESSNSYTKFFFIEGETMLVSKPIFEYDELLSDYGFIRCHQSHLINKKYIKSWIKEDGGYLLLEDDTQIPVSKLKKEKVLALLSQMK